MFVRTLSAAIVAGFFAQVSSGAVIALDARVGSTTGVSFATGSQLAVMRQRLIDMGHTIVNVTSYDQAALAGVDVLLTREAARAANAFTAQQAADIAAFNASGGGVGFFADGGFDSSSLVQSNNLVANALGANLGSFTYGGDGVVFTDFVSHPVTDGVNEWALDFLRQVDALPGSTDLTNGNGLDNIAVARDGQGGAGNAFVMGDASWLQVPGNDYGINDFDNSQAFTNIVDYLLIPAPSAAGLIAIAGVAGLRRRR